MHNSKSPQKITSGGWCPRQCHPEAQPPNTALTLWHSSPEKAPPEASAPSACSGNTYTDWFSSLLCEKPASVWISIKAQAHIFYFWLKQRVKFPHPLSRFLQIYLQLFLLSHFKFSPFFSLHRLIKSHLMFLQEFGTSIPGGVQKMTASDTSWDGSVGMRDWSKAGLDLRNLCYNFVIL